MMKNLLEAINNKFKNIDEDLLNNSYNDAINQIKNYFPKDNLEDKEFSDIILYGTYSEYAIQLFKSSYKKQLDLIKDKLRSISNI